MVRQGATTAFEVVFMGGEDGQKQSASPIERSIDEQILDAYTMTAMSVREIARRFGKNDIYVRRLAKKHGAQRADAEDVSARVDATVQRHVAQQALGRPPADGETQAAYIEATATVIGRQRADQREARAAVQRVIARLTAIIDNQPTIAETLAKVAMYAAATEDDDVRKAALNAIDGLHVEPLAKTARQLVASLRDLDAIERAAHGLKVPEQTDPNAARPRAMIVPAKTALPSDED